MPKGAKEFYKYVGWLGTASFWSGYTVDILPLRTDVIEQAPECDAVVFTGGADISEHWYSGSPHETLWRSTPIRDQAEYHYFKQFAGVKPILGICRGMQIINCFLGGNLVQDLKESQGYFPHVEGEHKIFFTDGSSVKTNSFHHQCVDKLGEGLNIVAKAGDGVVEIAEKPGIYLVQFHPEREGMCWDDFSKEVFRKLIV